MALSTNSVFHFTSSLDNLKGILLEKFKIKYCLEKVESRKHGNINFGVPMVSFCDIPLSQVSGHIDKYGGYGIGLKKSWAKRKGLNPVLYLEKDSPITIDILNVKLAKPRNLIVEEFLKYSKNYEGELKRGEEIINKIYRFYDEREWRYCPEKKDLNSDDSGLILNTEDYQNQKANLNLQVSSLRLNFTFKDISYIFVNDESEIIEIVNYIRSLLKNEKELEYLKI